MTLLGIFTHSATGETDWVSFFILIGVFVHTFGLGSLYTHIWVWYEDKYGFKSVKKSANWCLWIGILFCFYPGMWYYRKIYNERKKELENDSHK